MPEAMVPITEAWTLITQVAGTPSPATGALSFQERTGRSIRLGRGTATVPPAAWFVLEGLDGALGTTLDDIAPGGAGDHLWGQAVFGTTTITASWE